MHRHNGTDYQHANDCPHCWREASDIQSEVIERLSTKLAAEREAREKANHDLTEREHEIERLTRERATEAWRAEKAERERGALMNAVPFAIGAIEDAIYLEDGLDGDAGKCVIHVLREAMERGTFDKVKYGALPRPHVNVILDAVFDALGLDRDDEIDISQAVAQLKSERDEAMERVDGLIRVIATVGSATR